MDTGRETWFKTFDLLGDNVKTLKTMFQNDFTLEDAEHWAKEATQILGEVKLALTMATIWILATKGEK